MYLDELLKAVVDNGGSDLHLAVGVVPKIRLHGHLADVGTQTLNEDVIKECLKRSLTEDQVRTLVKSFDVDGLYFNPAIGRFRVNAFKQMGTYSLVFRHVPTRIATLDDLGLPPVLKKLAGSQRGIVLVTGTTGSGKSTTLAAMIDYINTNECCNIITIEDPVEFVHVSKNSVIRQRSLGSDVATFSAALKGAMRQDPDVILVGEMRDLETISAAVTAADTGHLVFSTVHTTNAQQTVERIMNYYAADQQDQIRLSLSLNLSGVISQRLIPRRDGGGRVAALEIMTATPTVRKLIREGQVPKLYPTIEEGTNDGMQSFNQVIYRFFADGLITHEEALAASSRPEELQLRLKVEGLV
ncbi:MAG: type IV pilus twitching motility protein PilT [Candidatus Riflebacteria bacterium]|nr:type IV pilus twitching motility protein PilT [Candidatus Riflebacteria bacterium]